MSPINDPPAIKKPTQVINNVVINYYVIYEKYPQWLIFELPNIIIVLNVDERNLQLI